MDARLQNAFEITINANKELVICPLSNKIMRHPVLASDGLHYELSELVKHFHQYGNTSPQSGEIIDAVTYDRNLQDILDRNYADIPQRYKEYDMALALDEIQRLLKPNAAPIAQVGFFATLAKIPGSLLSIASCGAMDDIASDLGATTRRMD